MFENFVGFQCFWNKYDFFTDCLYKFIGLQLFLLFVVAFILLRAAGQNRSIIGKTWCE